jgi:hypothetical protein
VREVLWSLSGVDDERAEHLADPRLDLEQQLVELALADMLGNVVVRVVTLSGSDEPRPDPRRDRLAGVVGLGGVGSMGHRTSVPHPCGGPLGSAA